jgi:hypothetical protein
MTGATMWHTATLLLDGRVLIAGGFDGRRATGAVELWDPETGAFSVGGPLSTARHGHSATLLGDGRVLFVGGATRLHGDDATATAEIWDPATGTSTSTGSMAHSRWRHGAALLADGRVLVIGGTAEAGDDYTERRSAEIWDPSTGVFSDAGSIDVNPTGVTATILADGRVLVVGRGEPDDGEGSWRDTAIVFDPATGTSTSSGRESFGREWHTATALPDGRVLIAAGNGHGGFQDTVFLQSIEVYDPLAGTFIEFNLGIGRTQHAAAVLRDGGVLITGGFDFEMDFGDGTALRSTEVWRPLP